MKSKIKSSFFKITVANTIYRLAVIGSFIFSVLFCVAIVMALLAALILFCVYHYILASIICPICFYMAYRWSLKHKTISPQNAMNLFHSEDSDDYYDP
jgi:hypothetical protein